jgi:WD40 repeat protein
LLLRTIQAHSGLVRTLSLFGNRLISGSYDKSIKVWDMTSYKQTLKRRNLSETGPVLKVQADDTKMIVTLVDSTRLMVVDFTEDVDTCFFTTTNAGILC